MTSENLFAYILPTGQRLCVLQADITTESVDAIVNAANEFLQHGGGVAGAIVRQGGALIQQESDTWVQQYGYVSTGTAAITSGGNLPALYVIHAVGPVWGQSGDDEGKLASAVKNALLLADQHNLKTISMPGISSGIFGGPKDICARTIIQAVVDYLIENKNTALQEVRFCNIDTPTTQAFLTEAQNITNNLVL